MLDTFQLRSGSGGAGAHKGGEGVLRRVRFGEDMLVNVLSSRRRVQPYGVAGGLAGAVGHNRVIRVDGTVEELPGNTRVKVFAGDRFEIETPGGGGFGTPI